MRFLFHGTLIPVRHDVFVEQQRIILEVFFLLFIMSGMVKTVSSRCVNPDVG